MKSITFPCIRFVSIQPKPKKGLEDNSFKTAIYNCHCGFNPAEAEEGFRRNTAIKNDYNAYMFQSSRSRRRV